MVVVQSDTFNLSRISTVVGIALTSQMKWVDAPGNVFLPSRSTGLDRDSVANVSQIVTVDRSALVERAGAVTGRDLERIVDGVMLVLGRMHHTARK